MTRREKRGIWIVFIFFLLLAFYQDHADGLLQENGILERAPAGEEEKDISLELDAEGIFEEYSYDLTIEPMKVTQEEAEKFFEETKKEIEQDFAYFRKALPIKKKYCEDMVKARWQFANREYVDIQGRILQEKIPEEGVVCTAEVTLSCGIYEEVYVFPFRIEKVELSKQEQLLHALEGEFEQQMQEEGNAYIQLPKEINGVHLEWREVKESRTVQVLLLEMVAFFLLQWGRKQQKEQEEKIRVQIMQRAYPDVVNQLSMLMETGMSLRQAWNKMAGQYERKCMRQIGDKHVVWEAIVCMNRRLTEGESERAVYEKFAEEINVRSYYRLMRTLIAHMDKGTTGLCSYLEEESRQAYEERVWNAKKLGEEASTRMLIPLIFMMLLVMVIVLLPAIIEIAV